MSLAIIYEVDMDLYTKDSTKQNIVLKTTEYIYKNNMLICLQTDKHILFETNNLLKEKLKISKCLSTEEFLFRKRYSNSKPKSISKSSFEERLSKIPINNMTINTEIIQNYKYIDKSDTSVEVQIVIEKNSDRSIAIIDFEDVNKYQKFVSPNWLIEQ